MRDQFHWDDGILETIRTSSQKRIRSTELQSISAELITQSRDTIVHSRKLIARISKSLTDLDE
jgi:hypothetical protein